MELCILQQLSNRSLANDMIVYLAPTRSLCSERFRDWQSKMRRFNVNCAEVTGDTDSYTDLRRVDLLVTTPEKLDVLTRRTHNDDIEKRIRLLMIDEVHLLNETRGATLEVVISRLKASQTPTRFIAISATIPNIADICEWLAAGLPDRCHLKQFGEEYRAVRLKRLVFGYPEMGGDNNNAFRFDYSLNERLGELISAHSDGKPTLVFCSTRKSTIAACEALAKQLHFPDQADINVEQLKDRKLAELVKRRLAFHHAGLVSADRTLIERLFISGQIRVICTTSTLACGVNLPAHLVIIKSTKMYSSTGFTEYSELDILQMIGRA
jgi:ATP-dependent DNA helicase HFM1/MER3